MVRQARDARKSVQTGPDRLLREQTAVGAGLFFSGLSGFRLTGRRRAPPLVDAAVLLFAAGADGAVIQRVDDAASLPVISRAGVPQSFEVNLQVLKRGYLLLDVGNVPFHKIVDPCTAYCGIVLEGQKFPDLSQIHAVQAAAADEVKPFHGIIIVKPVVGVGAFGRRKKALLLIVAYGDDLTARPFGQFPDFQRHDVLLFFCAAFWMVTSEPAQSRAESGEKRGAEGFRKSFLKKYPGGLDSIVAIDTTLISTRRINVKDNRNDIVSEVGSARACSCADAFVLRPFSQMQEELRHAHDENGHHHHHEHGHDGCCGHEHAPAEPVDMAALARASATTAVYLISNMDCPMEEALIRKRLGSVEGITGLEFNLMQRVLTVHHNLASTKSIEEALTSIDMIPEPLGDTGKIERRPAGSGRIAWKKLALAGIFAALSEGTEFALEWGVIGGAEEGFSLLESLPLLFALAAILLGGLGTYRKGWLAVSNFNLNINALMSVAVTGAVIIGQYPEAAMVMVLFNVSEAIEARALDRARDAIGKLLELAPERATVLCEDGTWKEKDIREIPVGSRVRVRPGERVALDGMVISGHSAVNQAPITGESIPVEKVEGDTVFAGTINTSGSFEFEVTAGPSDTTLARIIHAVEEAQGRRAPVQRMVDSFAAWYTPAVFLLALLTAVIPPLFFGWSWTESVYTGLVLLVIGCPCALVISTPVSIVSGLAAATKSGLLVKGGVFLEQGRLLRCLALDKTGTLTYGKPKLTDAALLDGESREEALRLAAALASRSDHPVSLAVAESAGQNGDDQIHVDEFEAVAGRGVQGRIGSRVYRLGSSRMMAELGLGSAKLDQLTAEFESQGRTVVALADDSRVLAVFAVADTIRESSRDAVRELRELGVHTVMLTGDNEIVARVIAGQAGVDEFRGSLLPEDKLKAVEGLSKRWGRTGMAGDGINDAPALARADIGFAMAGGGTDTAMETADVALMDDDLRKIPRFIRLSRATHSILVQNIAMAVGVKVLFFAMAFAGCATMWMAVFADVGTALVVVGNGLRAARYRG